ncbi:ionotropic receptor 93a-like [Macrobrachium rosenbergii]|uniref:ionotropic receptor 93a-like n=1 Tax=Macrobrachium rosenbergii TaxID=79674 RepID=UPI0034D73CF2
MARKGKTEIDPWGFVLPFTSYVWLYYFLSTIVVLFVAFMMSLILPSEDHRRNYSVSSYVRVLLLQAYRQSVDHWSSSILAATWMIAVLIVMASYVGNLRSILTVRYVPQPYQTIKSVMSDPSVKIITETGGYYHQSIKSGFFKELTDAGKESMVSYVEFTDFENVVDNEISQGGYVLMNDDLPSKMLIDHHFSVTGTCLFYLSKEFFFPQISAMIAPKYSPLIPVFNKRLIMIIESGLYDRWVRREYVNSSSCERTPTRILVDSTLSLFSIWGTFMILVGGSILGIIIFAWEIGSTRLFLLYADGSQ